MKHFLGAMINDMHDNLKPILKWNPGYIILHIGTNDAFRNTENELLDTIFVLKNCITTKSKNYKVYYVNYKQMCG